jgi:hypothetical protein
LETNISKTIVRSERNFEYIKEIYHKFLLKPENVCNAGNKVSKYCVTPKILCIVPTMECVDDWDNIKNKKTNKEVLKKETDVITFADIIKCLENNQSDVVAQLFRNFLQNFLTEKEA